MNANVVLDLNELAEYVASKALKIIEEKQKPVITNAQKFKEVFGLPAHCMIDQDAQWRDKPYKEPEVGQ